ncbi:MAG: LPS export ABC transporter permease LptG, partial [Alphaproteobacteria bacterium]|nr:LPS export ABC transporter permease LptG [Alphaproteobacteria bacterium]
NRWVLHRYLGRQYLLWFLAFLGGLAGIVFLFEVAELMRRAGGRPDVGFMLGLKMGVYKLPETIERILPFVVLFSGLFTFWRLARSQELIVARSVGVSAWQFLTPALLVTACFALVNVTVLNPIGAAMNARYTALEMRYLERVPTFELTGAGLWLRQHDGQNRYLLHADHVKMNPLALTPLMAIIYDKDGNYVGRVDAPKAVLRDGAWDASGAWINMDKQPAQHVADWRLPTTLTLGKIQESMAAPDTISFWELPRFIRALKTIGLPPTRHQLAFESLLSQPFLLCAMVFFAAAFALRMSRRGGVTGMIVLGALLGSFVYTLNNVVDALGVNQTLPVPLAAWAIPLVALALGNAALLHMEE